MVNHNTSLLFFLVLVFCLNGLAEANIIRALAIDGDSILIGDDFGIIALNRKTNNSARIGGIRSLIRDIAIDSEGRKWLATSAGVIAWSGISIMKYTTDDGLIDNNVNCVLIDSAGVKWFGTSEGLSRFDGTTWLTYDTSDGMLLENYVADIAIDFEHHIWASGHGVARYDGKIWSTYTKADGISDEYCWAITIDSSGTKWFATCGGVTTFDGRSWRIINHSIDPLGPACADAIFTRSNGDIWVGTGGQGINYFDGTNWRNYNFFDGVIVGTIASIREDPEGNMWVGGFDKICKFDGKTWSNFAVGELEITAVNTPEASIPQGYSLHQNYPNPFNPSTTLSFSLPRQTQVHIEIFNIVGQKIATLTDELFPPGTFSRIWDASSLGSGIYLVRMTAGNYVETKKIMLIK